MSGFTRSHGGHPGPSGPGPSWGTAAAASWGCPAGGSDSRGSPDSARENLLRSRTRRGSLAARARPAPPASPRRPACSSRRVSDRATSDSCRASERRPGGGVSAARRPGHDRGPRPLRRPRRGAGPQRRDEPPEAAVLASLPARLLGEACVSLVGAQREASTNVRSVAGKRLVAAFEPVERGSQAGPAVELRLGPAEGLPPGCAIDRWRRICWPARSSSSQARSRGQARTSASCARS